MKLIDLYKFKLAYRDNSFINLKIIEGDWANRKAAIKL